MNVSPCYETYNIHTNREQLFLNILMGFPKDQDPGKSVVKFDRTVYHNVFIVVRTHIIILTNK